MDRILAIEDDAVVQKTLRRLFQAEEYEIEMAGDGPSGLEAFRNAPPSLVILDLRLPGMPGRDICREIKRQSPSVPIIVLSAITDVTDKVLLLELGADDYVTKPFSPRELLARARVAIRKSVRPSKADLFAFDDVCVDFTNMELTRDGAPVPLTTQEFKLLNYFVQNAKRVISREELLKEVWGYNNYPTTRVVDNQVLKLRQRLEKDPGAPIHFRTVYGAGYRFVP